MGVSEPDTDDAGDAALFLTTQLVCNGTHFDGAVVPAIPFMLRLLSARGVSRRGAVVETLATILRISRDEENLEVDAPLKRRCLDAFLGEAKAILDAAVYFEATSLEGAMDDFLTAFKEVLVPLLDDRMPSGVRAILEGVSERPRSLTFAAARELEEELDPAEGENDGFLAREEAAEQKRVENRYAADVQSALLPPTLADDREALAAAYLGYRQHGLSFGSKPFLTPRRVCVAMNGCRTSNTAGMPSVGIAMWTLKSGGPEAPLGDESTGIWTTVAEPASFGEFCQAVASAIATAARLRPPPPKPKAQPPPGGWEKF